MLDKLRGPSRTESVNIAHRYGFSFKNLAISRHYNSDGHSGISDIGISVLELIRAAPDSQRAQTFRDPIELKCIHRLRCAVPLGLTIM